ncbi:MAG: hypothetical protein ABH863_04215, partial [Candidatus Micrarchaeota archaeon]
MPEFLPLALFLGIKHTFDADHLVAVSNLLARAKSVMAAMKLGISWAFGHMLTAAILTAVIFQIKEPLLSWL